MYVVYVVNAFESGMYTCSVCGMYMCEAERVRVNVFESERLKSELHV